jgi:hypothetical protein
MSLKLGPLKLPWPKSGDDDDPYWNFFLNQAPGDAKNVTVEMIRNAREGAVNPVKTELHSPEVTSGHIKELAAYLGAVSCGVVDLTREPEEVSKGYRFGVLCVVPADADPRAHAGIGGMAAVQRGLYVTFIVAAYIRECGIRATASPEPAADRLAVRAGLGKLNQAGRFVAPKRGTRVYVADLIRTDMPLAADG